MAQPEQLGSTARGGSHLTLLERVPRTADGSSVELLAKQFSL